MVGPIVFILASLAASSASDPPPFVPRPERFAPAPWARDVDREIELLRKKFKGTLGVYLSDPYRAHRFGFNADEPFYLASGVKLPFMIEVFRQAERGALSLDEELVYGEDDIRDGSPRLNAVPLGTRIGIRALLEHMMQASDNSASDMLAKRVGLERVRLGLEEDGIPGFTRFTYLIDVRRGVFRELDRTADDLSPLDIRTIRWTPIWEPQVAKLNELLGRPPGTHGKQDLMDAYDRYYALGTNAAPMASVGLLLEKLAAGEIVGPKASEAMIRLMMGAKTSTHRLLGRLPPGTRVAHKTGSQFMRVCDLGLIYLPDDKPLVAAICAAHPDPRISEDALARIARVAYDGASALRGEARR